MEKITEKKTEKFSVGGLNQGLRYRHFRIVNNVKFVPKSYTKFTQLTFRTPYMHFYSIDLWLNIRLVGILPTLLEKKRIL